MSAGGRRESVVGPAGGRYTAGVRALCAFDLDHTLVRSPLDLRAMRADIRAFAAARDVALPPAAVAWTVAETIAAVRAHAGALEAGCWAIARAHETRALDAATCEPGAPEALDALRAGGFALAVWTNNARPATEHALARCGLARFFTTVVTRDEAALKPDPAGLRLLRAAHPGQPIWVVGDSWVDGLAAQAGGAPFIAYAADPDELLRRGVLPRLVIQDLRALPGWLTSQAA
ncbi:MAG: HAD family hydrolase [Candidatus Rokubacteria bacterium]|nr:HAD family hydrolase [Candidatus Rokubacteria bacterium]